MTALYYKAQACEFDNGDLAICKDTRYSFNMYAVCEARDANYYPLDGEFYSSVAKAKQAINVISVPYGPETEMAIACQKDKDWIHDLMRAENRAPYKELGMFGGPDGKPQS